MKSTDEIPPQARRIFFLGEMQAVKRELDRLENEKERIEFELERAKAELEELAAANQQRKEPRA
ncbi:hypothetical protein [Trichloromonas sp.]|uniref:hypothetical protein n=1 Tax=Trichloromonas sp. TaxID=3069249 RepID=UPI003D814912